MAIHFADIEMLKTQNIIENKYDKKVVLYSGGLCCILVEGFIKADLKNSELHLYGDGDYDDTIKQISRVNPNIKYFGCVENSKIIEEQIKATLLINPRPTKEEFVKYSFPSKNIEYMASGTPIITTNLPSMPEEYKPYYYILNDESVNGVAKTLRSVLSLNESELYKKGQEAKNWVLHNKNNIIQTKRILDFVTN